MAPGFPVNMVWSCSNVQAPSTKEPVQVNPVQVNVEIRSG